MDLREKILSAEDISSEKVEIPEWGVTIEMRSISGRKRCEMRKNLTSNNGMIDDAKLYQQILINCAFDPETGEPIFTEADKDAILEKNGAVLESLAIVGMKLSGMSQDSIDDAEKNL